jgi:chromosomal replication initiator protein
MNQIWTSVKSQLKEKIPGHSYRMWIEPIAFHENENGAMVLSCPNHFSKKRISDNYGQMIEDAVSSAAGRAFKVRLIVGPSQTAAGKEKKQDRQMKLPHIDSPTNSGRLLRKDYTFDQFVVGKNSDFAYSAALSLASAQPGKPERTLPAFENRPGKKPSLPGGGAPHLQDVSQ